MIVALIKNITGFFIAFLISSFIYAQDCSIGNQDTTYFTAQIGDFTKNYLLGVRFKLPSKGALESINLVGKNTGSQVQMAVYDDKDGVPNNLIAVSGSAIVGDGIVSLPVTETQLYSGDYWVMAIYDSTAMHTYKDSSYWGSNDIYYTSLAFGDPVPSNASNFLSYKGFDFTYFLEIRCGTVGLDPVELSESQISIYPNPAGCTLNLQRNKLSDHIAKYRILDYAGRIVKESKVETEIQKIDVSSFTKGLYFLEFLDAQGSRLELKKIVKN